MKTWKNIFALVLGMATLSVSNANAGEAEIKSTLAKALPSLVIESVEKSEIPGLYMVTSVNQQVLFTNEDGSYFLTGEMWGAGTGKLVNLSEQRRGKDRLKYMSSIKDGDKITYPAKGETKAKITVFTDIDCGYCRKLHREIPEMNELGIEVSYMAYPRAGIGSGSYKKIVSAWCAEDPAQAMTDAKMGKTIPEKTCDNPVSDQFALGAKLGVNGTPAILLEDGTLVPGYLPAKQLAANIGVL